MIFTTTKTTNTLMLVLCSVLSLYTALHVNNDSIMTSVFVLISMVFIVIPVVDFATWLKPKNYLNERKVK